MKSSLLSTFAGALVVLLAAPVVTAQQVCPDGSDPVPSRYSSSWNVTYEGVTKHIRQPVAEQAGQTGEGSGVVIMERNIMSWFFEHQDGRPRPFGACVKPDDAAPDHWGWAPETDPAYPGEPCQIDWVMCISPDRDADGKLVALNNDGATAGLESCEASVDSYKDGQIGSRYSGGHATNTALAVDSVAPDARLIALSLPTSGGNDLQSYRAAFRWLYTKGWGYTPEGTIKEDRVYLSGADKNAWKRYWWQTFGSSSPIEKFGVVAANMSFTVVSDAYTESCEAINPAIPQTNSDSDAVIDVEDNCTLVDNLVYENAGSDALPFFVATQPDSDMDGYGNKCDADFDNDLDVDWDDVSLFTGLRDNFGSVVAPYDVNGDGVIDVADKSLLREAADFDSDGDIDADDTSYFANNLLNKPVGPSNITLLDQYAGLRNPGKYIQDRLVEKRGFSLAAKEQSFATEFAALRKAGVLPVVSVGNNGYANGVMNPACTPGAIAVTGIGHNMDLFIFNNLYRNNFVFPLGASIGSNATPKLPSLIVSHSAGRLWQPLDPSSPPAQESLGCYIDPTEIDGSNASWSPPTVAGAIAVLKGEGAFPAATPDDIEARLRQTDRRAYVYKDCTTPTADQEPYDPEKFDLWCPDTVDVDDAIKLARYSLPVLDLASAIQNDPDAPDADRDNDGILDEFDNCVFAYNPSQIDSDGDAYGNSCDADYNQDGTVDEADVNVFVTEYLDTDNSQGDFNNDGVVGWNGLRPAALAIARKSAGALGTRYGS